MFRHSSFRAPARLSPAGLFVLLLLAPAVARASFQTIIQPTGSTGLMLGRSVSSAGDFNGDGYEDVIVGRAYSFGTFDAGAALIYFGGPKSDNEADLYLRGETLTADDEEFGWQVSSAGDFNGDGYGDVIVSAARCDLDGTDAGRAYIYLGGASPNAGIDLVLHGEAAGDLFGSAVARAGDVDGDGYGDVIVGAPNNDSGGSNAGRAYIFRGGATPNATADVTMTGTAAADYFGDAVAGAGDVNDDGYDDIIVGAYANDAGGSYAGRVYLYLGASHPNAVADLTMTGVAGDYLGSVVSPAGDFNDDGYDDWLVCASQPQKVYIYHGGALLNATPDLTIALSSGLYSYYSHTAALVGNVNGDRYSDIIVGAYGGGSSTYGGAAFVYFGGLDPDTLPDLTLTAKAAGDCFGWALGAADWNNDGRDDVIAGAYADDAGGVNAGRFYVFDMGSATPAANRLEWTLPGAAVNDWLGCSVAGAGDINDDGYDDVIVGAQLNDAGGEDAGRAYVLYGGAAADSVADLMFTGAEAGDYCGYAVGPAGDVNGDGYDDFLVSAPWSDHGATDGGMVYLQKGGPASPALLMYATTADEHFGTAIAGAGDVNNDGYDDWIIGSPRATGGGKAYLYHGGATPNTTADVTFVAAAGGDEFGCSVGTAGDVNGDGYDDVIVGAHLNDAGGSNAGRAYVYYGGPGGPNTVADLVLTGEALGDRLGISVATAGDVNGDGFADVIVGAHLNDAGGTDAGRAYVFLGGPLADDVADLVLTGAAAGDYFGNRVAPAGDVNLDGCGDVLVAAPMNDGGGTDAGRVYVYYGALPNTASDFTFTGVVAYDHFGTAAASVGDVFGDGVPDIAIGAPLHDANGGASGEAYLYDFNRYHVTTPNGGEDWIGGATQTVSWLGAERADLYLSLDGGANFDLVGENVGGSSSNGTTVAAPNVGEDDALVKLVPREFWIAGSDVSDAVFDIVGPISVGPETPGLAFRAPWPNPAGAAVTLGFELPREAVVTVAVFDAAGREVARPIAAERFAAGRVAREWRPAGLAPGVYTVRAQLGEQRRTRRLVWLGGR